MGVHGEGKQGNLSPWNSCSAIQPHSPQVLLLAPECHEQAVKQVRGFLGAARPAHRHKLACWCWILPQRRDMLAWAGWLRRQERVAGGFNRGIFEAGSGGRLGPGGGGTGCCSAVWILSLAPRPNRSLKLAGTDLSSPIGLSVAHHRVRGIKYSKLCPSLVLPWTGNNTGNPACLV